MCFFLLNVNIQSQITVQSLLVLYQQSLRPAGHSSCAPTLESPQNCFGNMHRSRACQQSRFAMLTSCLASDTRSPTSSIAQLCTVTCRYLALSGIRSWVGQGQLSHGALASCYAVRNQVCSLIALYSNRKWSVVRHACVYIVCKHSVRAVPGFTETGVSATCLSDRVSRITD